MKKIIVIIIALLIIPIFSIAQENNAITCSDGIDNDRDGLIDCLDGDCANLPSEGCLTCLADGLSFADSVLAFNPTCPTNTNDNPQAAVGVSDFSYYS